jgi:hypothetical protein
MRPSARTPQPKNLRARRSPVHATGVEPSPTRSITVAVTSRREQGEGQRPHKSDTSHHRNNEQNIEPRHLGDSKSINFNWSNLPPPGFNVCPTHPPQLLQRPGCTPSSADVGVTGRAYRSEHPTAPRFPQAIHGRSREVAFKRVWGVGRIPLGAPQH